MLAPVIAVGIAAWLLLREGKEKGGSDDETPDNINERRTCDPIL